MVVSVLVTYDCGAPWKLSSLPLHSIIKEYHINSPGKDQNWKFKLQFLLNVYCFHTIIKDENS